MNSKGKALDDGHGSVGPIRRIRHKVAAETPRASAYFHSSIKNRQVENFNISEGFFSGLKKNLEQGGTNSSSKFLFLDSKPQSSEVSVPNVPTQSRQMARKILEHLERNPPTPKDKFAELMLATSWKKPQSSDATAIIPNKHNSLPLLGGLDSSKHSDQADKKNLVNWSEDRGGSIFKLPPMEAANEANGAVNNDTSASGIKVDSAVSARGGDAVSSLDFRKTWDSHLMSSHEVFIHL